MNMTQNKFATTLFVACCIAVATACNAAQFNLNTDPTSFIMTNQSKIQTLDIMGLGLTVEMLRQSDILKELDSQGDKFIIPQDPKYYYWDVDYRLKIKRLREADSLEHCISYFVQGWHIPTVSITAKKWFDESNAKKMLEFDYVDRLRQPAGLHAHQSKQLRRFFVDLPEGILASAFQFFETNPEAPALLLFVNDREQTSGDGYHKITDQTEASVAILLARRERVEAIRPYVRPSTGPNAYKPVTPSGMPPFQPTEFVPKAWLDWQIKQFDALPTIGILHRPVTVPYMKDKDGKPTFDQAAKASLMSDTEKQLAFQTGWKAAMSALPEGKKQARVFYDHGDPSNAKALVPLSLALHLQDPNFDLFDPKQGYNIHRRLGETGAASPLLMWANGLVGAWRNKSASVAVNLRDPNQATITVISPSNDTRRHPMGDPIDFGVAPVLSEPPPATK